MEAPAFSDGSVRIQIFPGELIDERMYLVPADQEPVVIDPHVDDGLLPYLENARLVHVFLTHAHYDHISGVNWLREHVPCRVYASESCAAAVESPRNTAHFPLLFIGDREKYDDVKNALSLPYVCQADVRLGASPASPLPGGDWLAWGTPGHSPGGMSYLYQGRYLFSGDSLLGNGMELKSIGASQKALAGTLESYQTLSGKILLFPGHGDPGGLTDYLSKARKYYPWI
ncbi:MAG TPA: hypothetical protein DDY87_01530 [Clostridiales bacterium]|nr:hypothetical protein [Clostridiales bacterium]